MMLSHDDNKRANRTTTAFSMGFKEMRKKDIAVTFYINVYLYYLFRQHSSADIWIWFLVTTKPKKRFELKFKFNA